MPQQNAEPRQAKMEQAYLQLRRAIEAGEYASNEHLVELPLSRTLGVSRNTLRAVLTRLEQEGFIVLEPNRGARVRAFSLEEAQDALRTREVLEGLVARLAAERITAKQARELTKIVDGADRALEQDDLRTFTTTNRQFHVKLVEIADSPQASSMLDSLHFPMVKFQFQTTMVPGRKTEVSGEHRKLLEAVVSGDADAAERVGRWHVGKIQETLAKL
ncbi:MAG: GntR family transcriptional regulator [Nocardioides sp.]|uniref:GntR family transcriptional regulator n=1 Tax=Nocardioides sp. TaxID=35761 RepID=UPI0039E31B0C